VPGPGANGRSASPSPVATLFVASAGRPLRLRGVTESDLPELHRLDKEVFQEHAYPYFALRQFYELYQEDLFVLDDGRTLHGYVLAGVKPDRSRSWILGLAIDQQWRRHGLGRWLMAESLRRLRAQGVGEVWLTVEPANSRAVDLYLSLGFTRVDHRPGYFGPEADRLVMVLPLTS
jgi:ribosomal protein S18 acetylase RimI-like enzyme